MIIQTQNISRNPTDTLGTTNLCSVSDIDKRALMWRACKLTEQIQKVSQTCWTANQKWNCLENIHKLIHTHTNTLKYRYSQTPNTKSILAELVTVTCRTELLNNKHFQ